MRSVEVHLTSDSPISKEMMGKIKTHLFRILPKCTKLKVYEKSAFFDNDTNEIIRNSWDDLLKYVCAQIPQARLWLCNSTYEVEKDVLNIFLENNGMKFFHKKRCISLIERYYENIGIVIKVNFKLKLCNDDKYSIYEEDRELVEAILNQNKGTESEVNKECRKNTINPIGKIIEQDMIPIADANKSG